MDTGEGEGGSERDMGDSDSSDSDVIGPPLPPGYSSGKRGDSAGMGPSSEGGEDGGEEEESEEEGEGDESVGCASEKRVQLLIFEFDCVGYSSLFSHIT